MIANSSKEFESLPYGAEILTFSGYRELCDTGNRAFRKVGLLDPRQYEAVLFDRSTLLFESPAGYFVPAVTNLEFAAGYDAPKTRSLVGCEQVYFLALRPDQITGDGVEVIKRHIGDSPMLIETKGDDTDDV